MGDQRMPRLPVSNIADIVGESGLERRSRGTHLSAAARHGVRVAMPVPHLTSTGIARTRWIRMKDRKGRRSEEGRNDQGRRVKIVKLNRSIVPAAPSGKRKGGQAPAFYQLADKPACRSPPEKMLCDSRGWTLLSPGPSLLIGT